MTLLNEKPLKGYATNPITNKKQKALLYFIIHANGDIEVLANFYDKKYGYGGACCLETNSGYIWGYLYDTDAVKINRYELNKNRRGF